MGKTVASGVTFATEADVRAAIEGLTQADSLRIRFAARAALMGTAYDSENEIINEAVVRTLAAARGEKGRRWPLHVKFVAFFIMTLRGLGDDSRNSELMTKTTSFEGLLGDVSSVAGLLANMGETHESPLHEIIDEERAQERAVIAQADWAAIDAEFSENEDVLWLIEGRKTDMPRADILEVSGMTMTRYETAKKQFHRGLDKLFPGRRTK